VVPEIAPPVIVPALIELPSMCEPLIFDPVISPLKIPSEAVRVPSHSTLNFGVSPPIVNGVVF
jgi:hypothetical protein